MRALPLLAALTGCSLLGMRGVRVDLPNQAEAVRLVWEVTYKRTDKAPGVRWVKDGMLTCKDPNSGRPGFKTTAGCREGYTLAPWEVSVAWHDGDSFGMTALAHELLHVVLLRQGILDMDHSRREWTPMETCNAHYPSEPRCGLVDRANLALNGM